MRVNVREARVNDGGAILGFFLSLGKVQKEEHKLWLKRWEFLFLLNPLFSGPIRHPIGWVIESEDGVIRGYAGNIILPYIYERKYYRVACTTSIMVEAAYRRHSMSMLKEYFTQTGIDIFMSSTANEISGKIFEVLKISRFPDENYNTMYYFLINPTKVFYHFLRRYAPDFFARAAAAFIGMIVAPWFHFRDLIFINECKMAKDWKIVKKSLEELDETYDEFWELIKNQKNQLMFLRTRETLQWHFAGAGNWGVSTILCYYERSQMLGYIIVDKHLEKESGILRFRCVDILTSGDKSEIIKRLVMAAYIQAKKEGADLFIGYFFPLSVQKVVNRLAHLRRKRNGGVYIQVLNPLLFDIHVERDWYATCADGDSALWNLTTTRL